MPSVDAGTVSVVVGQPVEAGAPPAECTGKLICQNFEGAGYDNGESWTEGGTTTPDEDYTGVVLRGSQSVLIQDDGTAGSTYSTFTEAADAWIFMRFRIEETPGFGVVAYFQNDAGTTQARLETTSGGVLRLYHGTSYCGNTSPAADTTYFIWVHYALGTGADGVGALYIDTDRTRPAADCAIATGTSTDGLGRVILYVGRNDAADDCIYDQVLVDDAEITDVTE